MAFSGTSLQKTVMGVRAELARQWQSGLYTVLQGEQAYEHYHHPNYRHFNGGITQLSAYVTQAFGKRWHVYGVYDLTYKHSPDPRRFISSPYLAFWARKIF